MAFSPYFSGETATLISHFIPVAKAAEDAPTISNAMILPFSLAEKAFTCGEAVTYREYASKLDLSLCQALR